MFGLELEPSKTRLIEFGKFAKKNRKEKNMGKPETFDFLGFTHYCGESQNGWYGKSESEITWTLSILYENKCAFRCCYSNIEVVIKNIR